MESPIPTGNENNFQSHTDTNPTITAGQSGLPTGGPESHAGILASNSDDLFHPDNNNIYPSLPYTLPDVPIHQNYHLHTAYIPPFSHIPINRDHLHPPFHQTPHTYPIPSLSSYNH